MSVWITTLLGLNSCNVKLVALVELQAYETFVVHSTVLGEIARLSHDVPGVSGLFNTVFSHAGLVIDPLTVHLAR